MLAGYREDDACRARKDAFDGKSIEIVASKNNELVWQAAHFRLVEILTEGFRVRQQRLIAKSNRRKVVSIDPPTLTVNSLGKPWTPDGFRARFFKLIAKLEAEGKIAPGLTFHGLRHTQGKLIIESGGSKTDVGLLLGDRSEAVAAHYGREHEKRKRNEATVRRLEQMEREKTENRSSKVENR
jgi:integrase